MSKLIARSTPDTLGSKTGTDDPDADFELFERAMKQFGPYITHRNPFHPGEPAWALSNGALINYRHEDRWYWEARSEGMQLWLSMNLPPGYTLTEES